MTDDQKRDQQMHEPAATVLAVRVDRVIAACLQEDNPPDEAIMFRFRSMAEFRRFIQKVLVVGSVRSDVP